MIPKRSKYLFTLRNPDCYLDGERKQGNSYSYATHYQTVASIVVKKYPASGEAG
jgi:hypothetical protein